MPKTKTKIKTAGKTTIAFCPSCRHSIQPQYRRSGGFNHHRHGGFFHNTKQGEKCSYDFSCDEGLICTNGTCQPRTACGFGRRCIPSEMCWKGKCLTQDEYIKQMNK